MSADTPVTRLSYRDDPLRQLARLLLERHAADLPDLSRQTVLLPHTSAVLRFRRLLREQAEQKGYLALLPPFIGSLSVWIGQHQDTNRQRLSPSGREILLLDLMKHYPRWQRGYGEWPLVDSLLDLFDELTRYDGRVPDDQAGFLHFMAAAHDQSDADALSPLSDEARMVHTLWHAWRERLADAKLLDPTTAYNVGLSRSLEKLDAETRFYLAGFVEFTPAESRWLQALHAQQRLSLVLHANGIDETSIPAMHTAQALDLNSNDDASFDPYSDLLDRVFASHGGLLRERASRQAEIAPISPARDRLTLHQAASAEAEARAVDVQIRRWLDQGLRDIGIVTHDRRLARRLRALLERAGIGLVDTGGWALSTTSAATALARWLECVEQDFAHRPLLELMKSPFLKLDLASQIPSALAARFEQDVVRAFGIGYGLENYRRALERIHGNWDAAMHMTMAQWLTLMTQAAAPLTELVGSRSRPAHEFLEALWTSLEQLGLKAGLESDDAGRELLSAIDEMHAATAYRGLQLNWANFQRWLRRTLEQRRYHPHLNDGGVELMGFAESRLHRFDGLIIAGAIREHLPGPLGAPSYFTDSVRIELGLPSLARRYAIAFQDFRRLLEAAPRVLVSLRREQDGEPVAPSPWVERIRAFHALAYDSDLNDPELDWLSHQDATVITDRSAELPPAVSPPAPSLPRDGVPESFTAGDCQLLIDCPYQYFAARGLGLEAEDEVREEIEKKDYGKHIHRILQAFHLGVAGLPGPWDGRLDDTTLAEAEKLMRRISEQVFARDVKRRYLARGWQFRWEECIPVYLKWERQRAARWRVEASELAQEHSMEDAGTRVRLTGRIDRIDRDQNGHLEIIDYKTGAIPKSESVLNGESIQLPFYALMLNRNDPMQALYLMLDRTEVKEQVRLSESTLSALRLAMRQRLLLLKRGLDAGAPLPACGDQETCARCDKEGLCRRGMWWAGGSAA